jgi:hypothetical protein
MMVKMMTMSPRAFAPSVLPLLLALQQVTPVIAGADELTAVTVSRALLLSWRRVR